MSVCDSVLFCVFVQMSSEKPPASGQQPAPPAPGPSNAVPQSTPLFRAMNFELFVKPVGPLLHTLFIITFILVSRL